MEGFDCSERLMAQVGRELDPRALAGLRVVDRPFVDGDAEHFFKAERLGAELGMVIVPAGFFTCLVFDWSDSRDFALRLMHLNKVSFTIETKSVGPDWQRAQELPSRTVLVAWQVGVFMVHIALGGVFVSRAKPVGRLQCCTAGAVEKVVQQGKGKEVVHDQFTCLSSGNPRAACQKRKISTALEAR